MDKRVREISPFFVAPRREFAPAVWRVSRTLLSRNTSTSVVKTLTTFCDIEYRICSCLTKLFNNYQLPLSVEIRLPRWRSKSCAAISLTLCGTCRRGRRRLRRRRPHRLTSRTQLVSTAIASPPAAATSTCMPLRSLGIMLIWDMAVWESEVLVRKVNWSFAWKKVTRTTSSEFQLYSISIFMLNTELCKIFLLSLECHTQNVPLPNRKLHYGGIFQPTIPKAWQYPPGQNFDFQPFCTNIPVLISNSGYFVLILT